MYTSKCIINTKLPILKKVFKINNLNYVQKNHCYPLQIIKKSLDNYLYSNGNYFDFKLSIVFISDKESHVRRKEVDFIPFSTSVLCIFLLSYLL